MDVRRQAEGHDVAGPDTGGPQAGGDGLGTVVQAGVAGGGTARIDECRPVAEAGRGPGHDLGTASVGVQASRSRWSMVMALPRTILSTVACGRCDISSSATFFVCGQVESVWG